MTEYLDFDYRLSVWGVKHSDLMCAMNDKESIIQTKGSVYCYGKPCLV